MTPEELEEELIRQKEAYDTLKEQYDTITDQLTNTVNLLEESRKNNTKLISMIPVPTDPKDPDKDPEDEKDINEYIKEYVKEKEGVKDAE